MMDDKMEREEKNRMPKRHIFGYASGHFYNDLCGSMWMSYFLIYMEKVVGLGSEQAGSLMNLGQVSRHAVCNLQAASCELHSNCRTPLHCSYRTRSLEFGLQTEIAPLKCVLQMQNMLG